MITITFILITTFILTSFLLWLLLKPKKYKICITIRSSNGEKINCLIESNSKSIDRLKSFMEELSGDTEIDITFK